MGGLPSGRLACSIDAGSGGSGVALWDAERWDECCSPLACRNFGPRGVPKGAHWQENVNSVLAQFCQLLEEIESTGRAIFRADMEMPQFYDDAGGHMCAKTGDLQKLVYCVGSLGEALRSRSVPLYLHEVHDWKGQLPKEVVISRLKRRIPDVVELDPVSHSWDAIGVGLYAKGFFRK